MKSFKHYEGKKIPITFNLKIFSIFLLTLFFGFPNIDAHSMQQESVYSFDLKNEKLTNVLKKIEKETGYVFFYYNVLVDSDKVVNLNTKDLTIGQTLDKLFVNTNNKYTIDGRQIYIRKQENSQQVKNTAQTQQSNKITISGLVTDKNGEPVIGASVVEKGTTNGTITDINGHFTLNVKPNSTIVVSFIGYTPKTIVAKAGGTFNVKLEDDMTQFDEVVVIGYGTQRRSLVTSAISKLTLDESNTRQVSSPSQLLNGRIAGVSTSTSSGNLGSGERMSIRGMASISAGNEPLYVIDGVPITNDAANLFSFGESMSSLASLNITDIESIEVLKDAASAAIYGSRATNGVIVITTKSGKEGRSDININIKKGFSKFPNAGKLKLANSDLYLQNYNEGIDNYNKQYGYSVGSSGYKTHISNPFGNLPDTDWMDLITQTGESLNIDASFSGGNKSTKYYVGVNYDDLKGIMKSNEMNKVNLKAKVSHEFGSWLEIGANTSANYVKNNQVPGADIGSTIIGRAIEQRPFDRPYKPNGEYYVGGTDELTRHNPMQILNEQIAYIENYRFIGNYYGMLKYSDILSWKYSFSADVNQINDYKYYNEKHPYGMGFGRLVDQSLLVKNFVSENVINYNDKFGDVSLSGTLGHSFQKVTNQSIYAEGRNFPSPSFQVGSAAAETESRTSLGVYAMESYFGRATVAYMDKYILTGTLRGDGSSKFSKENRWGWFPSLSMGWNISNEKFMKDSNADLKFRVSYGKTGNQAGIGRYAYQSLMSGGYNYKGGSGIAVSSFGNENLTWEKADQYDAGIDLALFNGRVNMMLDVYQKNTKDLLYNRPVHATTGMTSIMSNIGSMRNRGVEFTLNTHLSFGKVEWLSQFNIATNKNKIVSLIDESTPITIGSNRALQVGEELGKFYIFAMDGIYQYDGEVPKQQYDMGIRAGDVKWRDVDNNGVINDNDRVLTGSSNPDFSGGWNNTFRYNNFQLDVFLTYMYGNDVYAQWMTVLGNSGYRMAKLAEYAENTWTGPGSTNRYTRSMNGDVNNNRNSDRWLKDGSFIRLRALTLSYQFPAKVISPLKLKGLRLFCQGDNLFILTKYPGWDPEISNNLDPQYFGVDNYSVPQPRSFIVGASITF